MSELQKDILKDTGKRKIYPGRLAIWFIKGKQQWFCRLISQETAFCERTFPSCKYWTVFKQLGICDQILINGR